MRELAASLQVFPCPAFKSGGEPPHSIMNVQLGGGAKALDESDRAGGRFFAFDVRLFDEERIDGAMDDLQ